LGRGGITVNDEPVRVAFLGVGDVLRLGQVIIRVNFEEPAPSPAKNNLADSTWDWGGPSSRAVPALPPANEGQQAVLPRRPYSWNEPPEANPQPPALLSPAQPLDRFGTGQVVGGGELVAGDPALNMVLNHFGQMQQQMLDQFQQSMMMMMQMFSGMHHDQM